MRPLIAFDAAPEPAAAAGPLPAWLTWAAAAGAAAYLALFAACLLAGTVLKPFSDSLSFIDNALDWREGRIALWPYLWSPHAGHHTVWVRLLFAAETAVGGAWPTVVVCTLLLLATAGLLASAAWRDLDLGALRAPAALLCAMLVLTGFDALDAAQPLDAPYPFCVVFAVLSLLLFAQTGGGEATTAVRRGLALLAAVAAALGDAVALALWPVLAALAFFNGGRRPALWAAAVAAVGAAFSALYLAGPDQLAALGGAGAAQESGVARRLLYVLDFIGLPWSRASGLAGAVIGAALLAVCAWAVGRAARREPRATERLACGLIVFTVLSATLAAAGRGGLGETVLTPMRYALFASLLQAGLVLLLAREAQGRLAGQAGGVAAGVAAIVGLLLVQQAAALPFVRSAAGRVDQAIAAYERGERTPVMASLIYPDMVYADRVEARLRRLRAFGKAPQELARAAASSTGRTP